MDKLKLTKYILYLSAGIEVVLGLLHFVMPYFLYTTTAFTKLPQNVSDFFELLIYAVGILLIAFGLVGFLLSSNMQKLKEILVYYILIKIILWIARIIIELLYPIKLSMFYIEPFTNIVLPGLLFELALFISAYFLLKRDINDKKIN